jgi:hypothetical protein
MKLLGPTEREQNMQKDKKVQKSETLRNSTLTIHNMCTLNSADNVSLIQTNSTKHFFASTTFL